MNIHTLFDRLPKVVKYSLAAVTVCAVIGCFFAAALVGPFFAHAYQVKRIIHGSATVGTGTEVGTVNLSISSDPLEMENSAVFYTSFSNSNDDNRQFTDVLTLIDDPETVQFSRRATSTNSITVAYSVLEFAQGAHVISA